jgi:HAD superfamily hydrolase (TIGR01549 family)
MALPRALLCDLDDTIIEFEVHADSSWMVTCKDACRDLAGMTPQRLFDAIIASRTAFWADPITAERGRLDLAWSRLEVASRGLRALGLDNPALVERVAADYTRIREAAVKPFVGAVETLQRLRECDVRLALLTNGNGNVQRMKIDRFGLAPLFEVIWIEGERGAGKPDHRVFKSVLHHLNVSPNEAWMIGDNLRVDIEPAQDLGIHDIWVDWGGNGVPPDSAVRPSRVVSSIAALHPSRRTGKEL